MKNEITGPLRLNELLPVPSPAPAAPISWSEEKPADPTARAPRLAAVLVPAFPAALFVRDHPAHADQPVVIAASAEESSPVISCNARAASCGVTSLMTVAQARVRADKLVVGIRSEETELEQSSRLINKLQSLTPFVEEDQPGRYLLDVAGLMLLYKTETEFARSVIRAVATMGLPSQVGIAANKYVAAVAAETAAQNQTEPIVLVPDRQERVFLAELDIAYLPVTEETKEKLRLLGVRTIGQVARFRGNELIDRFGSDGHLLVRLSRGDDDAAFVPEPPEEDFIAERSLLFPISTSAALCLQVERLLQQLFARLRPISKGCSCVDLMLTCENRQSHLLSIAVEAPTLAATPFLRQLRQKLEQTRLAAGIVQIRVSLPNIMPLLAEQLSLPHATTGQPAPESLIDLQSTGRRDIYRYQPRYSTLPEKSFVLVPVEETLLKNKTSRESGRGYRPYARSDISGVRLLQPPRQIEVILEESVIRAIVVNRARARVRTRRGPWRLSGHWWHTPFDRRYYEIETTDGRWFLIFSQPPQNAGQLSLFGDTRQWFVQGVFD